MYDDKRLRAVCHARIAGPSVPFGCVTLLGVSVEAGVTLLRGVLQGSTR